MATELSTLLHLVSPYVPSCPAGVQLQQLRKSAREFCDDSECWQEELDTITSVADQAVYTMAHSYTAAIVKRAMWVKYEDGVMNEAYYEIGNTTITFDPAPDNAGDIDIKVVFLPLEACTSYPDDLVELWGSDWADGALARLFAMDGMPWGNMNMAAIKSRSERDALNEAKRLNFTQRLSGDLQIDIPAF